MREEAVTIVQEEAGRRIGYGWVVVAVIFLISVAAPVNLFKVPPIMPVLINVFHLSLTFAGLLMSVFSLAGLALALPAGVIMSKAGPKWTGIISGLFMIGGSLAGAYCLTAGQLLAARTLEGVGMAVMGVLAPTVITYWIPREKRGMALGVWSTWIAVGLIISMNVAPALEATGGWQRVWWFGTIFSALSLIVFWFFFRMPEKPADALDGAGPASERAMEGPATLRATMAIRDVWLIAGMLLIFNVMMLALNAFMPTFLVNVHGFSMPRAGLTTCIVQVVMIISAPLGGHLADRIGSRKISTFCFALIAVLWFLPFSLPKEFMPWLMIAFGLLSGAPYRRHPSCHLGRGEKAGTRGLRHGYQYVLQPFRGVHRPRHVRRHPRRIKLDHRRLRNGPRLRPGRPRRLHGKGEVRGEAVRETRGMTASHRGR